MTIEEIEAVVERALSLRPPRPREDYPPSQKIAAIEDYLLESANVNAELEACAHYLTLLVDHFKAQVESINGWEVALPNGKRGDRVTQADVLCAKRKIDPTSFDAGQRARQLRETTFRQIARFEYEFRVLSRVYTLIVGAA